MRTLVGMTVRSAQVLLAGCGASGGHALTVTRDGRQLARLDLAALRALPQTHISTPGTGNGGEQDGPGVAAVLEKAGPVDGVWTVQPRAVVKEY